MKKAIAIVLFLLILVNFQIAHAQTPTPEPDLSDGIISCFELDEESGIRSDSIGSNDLSDNNTVGFTSGKIGNASYYSNSGEYLYKDNHSFPTGANPRSYMMWAKSGDVYSRFINTGSETDCAFFHIFMNGGAINFECNSDTLWITGFSFNVWNLVGITYDGSSAKLYRNLNSESKSMSLNTSNNRFKLGEYTATFSIDLFMVWDRALTLTEITDLYNSGSGRSCAYIESLMVPPTSTPLPTSTPSDERQVSLSSGDWMTIKREVSYGDLSVSIIVVIGLLGFALFAIIITVDRWIRK